LTVPDHSIKDIDHVISPTRRRGAKPPPLAEETRARILDAAEQLFADRGIEAVSVRSILAAAGVSPALAHYHFGSRAGLVEALLQARVTPLVDELVRAIDDADSRGRHASLEDVLRAYFGPTARWLDEQPRLGRLLAQLHASPSPEIRTLGREVLKRPIARLGEAVLPRLAGGVDPRAFFLRFYLLVGGPSFLSAMWDHVRGSARRHLGPDVVLDRAWITDELVRYGAAVLRDRPAPDDTRR
jgi:AcrR family transcriptional regulator